MRLNVSNSRPAGQIWMHVALWVYTGVRDRKLHLPQALSNLWLIKRQDFTFFSNTWSRETHTNQLKSPHWEADAERWNIETFLEQIQYHNLLMWTWPWVKISPTPLADYEVHGNSTIHGVICTMWTWTLPSRVKWSSAHATIQSVSSWRPSIPSWIGDSQAGPLPHSADLSLWPDLWPFPCPSPAIKRPTFEQVTLGPAEAAALPLPNFMGLI